MAERLPPTAEAVADLKHFMQRVARGPGANKSTRKRRAARAQRKRNRRR